MEDSEPLAYPEGMKCILRRTFGLYASHFLVFAGIVGVIQLPINAITLYLLSSAETAAIWRLPYFALVIGTGFLATAPVTHAVSKVYAGAKPGVLNSYLNVLPLTLPLLGAFLLWSIAILAPAIAVVGGWLMGLAVMVVSSLNDPVGLGRWALVIAFMLFGLAGITAIFGVILYVRLMLTPSVVAIEKRGNYDALRCSWRLVSGRSWTALGTILIAVLSVAVIQAILMAPVRAVLGASGAQAALGPLAPSFLAVTGAAMLITMLLWPLPTIATALLYFDFRRQKQDTRQETETDLETF